MFYGISNDRQFFSPKGSFATSRDNLEEMIEFLEDMILLTGCPECNSLNTRLLVTDTGRILMCLDCGNNEILPPPS